MRRKFRSLDAAYAFILEKCGETEQRGNPGLQETHWRESKRVARLSRWDDKIWQVQILDCPFCLRTGTTCMAIGPRSFLCTRAPGHTGQHMACSRVDHKLMVWDESGIRPRTGRNEVSI